MCRLAAYLGRRISLHNFFSGSQHSLVTQSYQPGEMHEAILNADGFGIGWYDDSGQAVSYKHTLPAWSDTNLVALGNSLSQSLWVANVRSATPGQAVHLGNTQPFIHNNLHFMHNGFIDDFQTGFKERLVPLLDADIISRIPGDTDSAWIAALFHQQIKTSRDIGAALGHTCQQLESILGDGRCLLNLVVTDGKALHAVRH
ncbi:MAG: class II glutamine amidotransferase, partial [Thiotrichales bacterium]|nr:class II glutamine amidotransferase [Thiotrichales bacterium]